MGIEAVVNFNGSNLCRHLHIVAEHWRVAGNLFIQYFRAASSNAGDAIAVLQQTALPCRYVCHGSLKLVADRSGNATLQDLQQAKNWALLLMLLKVILQCLLLENINNFDVNGMIQEASAGETVSLACNKLLQISKRKLVSTSVTRFCSPRHFWQETRSSTNSGTGAASSNSRYLASRPVTHCPAARMTPSRKSSEFASCGTVVKFWDRGPRCRRWRIVSISSLPLDSSTALPAAET